MNVTVNRLSIIMTDAQVLEVKKNLKGALDQMPFLIGLTVDERVSIPKISESNKVFVSDSINALNNNGAVVPSYLDVAEVQKDLTLYEQLDEIELLTLQLLEKIQDTRMLAGSEAYITSLAAYRLFEAAAAAGIPGADAVYDALKQRFANQGPSNPPQS